MPYRFRAHIYFKQSATGIATWFSDQVNQRLGMAFHLNPGQLNEEKSKHRKITDFEWEADIFVPDESQAIMNDFWAHIMELKHHMETRVVVPEEGETEYLQSYMDVHYCFNDVNQPCQEPYLTHETPIPEEPQEPGDLCETTADWSISNATFYQTEFGAGRDVYVKHNGSIWKAKTGSHLWIAPAKTGNGSISWQWEKDCT